MHPNRSFAWSDDAAMLKFVADISFSTLFVAGEEGGFVFHVPVVVAGERQLRFHVAKSNRGAAALPGARAVLSCLGPDAYISPDWYETPDQVPTWNYVAVEAEGRLRQLDEAELAEQLDSLGAAEEARLAPKAPWTRAKMTPGRFEGMMKAILGFAMEIEALRGTRKLAQHKNPAEIEGAAAGVAAAGRPDMAALMRAEAKRA